MMVGIFTSFETFIVGLCNDAITAIITEEGHLINLSFYYANDYVAINDVNSTIESIYIYEQI